MGSILEKNSSAVRKRIQSHTFSDEGGDEYEASAFGGFNDYFRRKKIKLQNLDSELRAAGANKPQIFKGVVAHVTGYTQPPLHVLHKDLVQHGAGFLQYLDSKTMATHIIASSMPPKKRMDYGRYRIVKPAWVLDSIQAGRLLPWSDYRLMDEGPRQKMIRFDGGRMTSQAAQHSQAGYQDQTERSFYTSQFRKARGEQGPNSPFKPSPATRGMTCSPVKEAVDDANENGDVTEVDLIRRPSPEAVSHVGEGQCVVPPSKLEMQRSVSVSKTASSLVSYPPLNAPMNVPAQTTTETGHNQNPVKPEMAITSEEHNARLLADPRIRKSTTANPDFIKQFYSESRLHHLSTWKAELKSKMRRLAAENGLAFKSGKCKPGARRYIMHVDFDSFFCAVSLKKAPEYVDRPAVVAHSNGAGSEIASCNYPARKFGVKNGMWMKRAQELCPDLKVLPYDFAAYEEASQRFYEVIMEVGGVVQSVSIDEALIDATAHVLEATGSKGFGVSEGSIWREQEKADEIAAELRRKIKERTGCNVSVGIGGNILLAKVALRKAKPAGQAQIKPGEALAVLAELKVEDLPGVAYSVGGKLEEIGIKLVRDLRETSKDRLTSALGPRKGERLWEYARGIDRAEVGDQPIRKTVSAEVNWGIRFISQDEAEEFVRNLCKELERRLLNESVKGRQLTVKMMRRALDAPLDPLKHLGHGKCDTFNKSVAFGVSTNNAELIAKEAVSVLRSYKFSPGDIRGLGVQLSKLEPLKPSANTNASEGSQKKIKLGAVPASVSTASLARPPCKDPIEDTYGPTKLRRHSRDTENQDPISDEPLTPRKPKTSHPVLALSKAGEADSKANTPLNVTGTQFLLPANVDLSVLAELPPDIRSRLLAQGKAKSRSPSRPASPHSPAPPDVDLEVFSALPDDVKAEIKASYRWKAGLGQTLLPQSPRKNRFIYHPKSMRPTTPTKRGIRDASTRTRKRQTDVNAHLVQTSFLPGARDKVTPNNSFGNSDLPLDDLDPSFLSELPDDVRREVIQDHRRRRLAFKASLSLHQQPSLSPHGRTRFQELDPEHEAEHPVLTIPPAPPRISFGPASSTQPNNRPQFRTLPEIKTMLTLWHRETLTAGPHPADLALLEEYLARVVTEERDCDKARRAVRWLAWLIEEQSGDMSGENDAQETREKAKPKLKSKRRPSWVKALDSIQSAVQEALKARGLGKMDWS